MGKLFWIIIIFVIIGGWIIIKANSYEPTKDFDDTKDFIIDFGKWLFQVGKSTKNTVQYAADQEWLPQTNESINKTTNASLINETNNYVLIEEEE